MKVKEFISPATLFFSAFSVIILIANIFFNIHPFTDYFNYLESNKAFWAIPLSILIPIWFFLFDRIRYKKILDEKIELFQITVHTVQDIVQNSATKIQLLIMDMEESQVDSHIIEQSKKALEESALLIKTLSSLDPLSLNINSIYEKLKVFDLKN